ncbi:MAG TPA: molecular chaperone HtpG [Gammaproteobacteria bacterium]|nr:molecular chaperone HtpG [Gammaproteobacteria bacterium]
MSIEAQQEKLSFQAEVKQLLNIVVHSLYSNKEIFLRELISNASDATDKLRFEAISDPALYENDSALKIKVTINKEARTITISDNGIGMSRDDIIQHLGTIAKSGTREFMAKLTGDQKKDSHLIGQFGVGFYSAFIVADKVTVHSRRAGLGAAHGVAWSSAGDGEYTVENIEKADRGTDVILHLKTEEDDFLNDWRIRSVIKKYSDHLNLPILMPKKLDDGADSGEFETVNEATALWTLPKTKITLEQYHEFYKHIAHDFENPLTYVHNKVEGSSTEYTSILYIPSHAPFDLWQRDAKHGLKLYVQRVFIMDNVEQFLPHYLRFVRGVLDTTALPLNVSREILQDHPTIPKLKSALVRHVLELLEGMMKNEPDHYNTFWKNFGNVLKEGPAEDFSNREKVSKLLRFSSTHESSDDQTVTFAAYVERMKPAQKKIYYLTADSLSAARSSPHLEIFRKHNIEVLLLTDKIDEWVVGHLTEVEGKPLQSVAKGDLSLDEIEPETEAQKEKEKEKETEQHKQFDGLIAKMQGLLSAQVKEVRLSHRLTSSPVCLVRDQNAMGAQMERLLKAAGQSIDVAKPILEINAEHAIIREMNTVDDAKLAEWSTLLYEQALLSEGSALPDPAAFVHRMNKLWIGIFK